MMIDVKVHGSTGTVVLSNPSRRNALSSEGIEQLSQALDDLRQERKVRGIVITGAGSNFCSGLDLRQLAESLDSPQAIEVWHSRANQFCELVKQILVTPKPVIAAVDGPAMGAGLALALACDLIIASHRSTFEASSARRGIVSGFTAPLLNFRLGASVAAHLTLGMADLAATEAKDIGLVQHVVESEQVWVRASTWIDEIAAAPHEAVQLSKRVLNEMVGETLMSQLSSGAAAMATSLTTEVAAEGIRAFADGRPPEFPS
ncbi:MAG TPA: enoyl-CoA hydratase/isomerase family protein [Planctomycetaceae bacterium]|nr:enoyl-CoA hydratase/isomerase family protein [Planctomycetaceae bacterium]